ncbi:MAG: adenine deaminase [candidate division NC10 bacterium]|nr:adenine deaminase [candidate division NC10 bacterium]MBI2113460.1 adenine deaminase [candidate division NC10 bacterium]MBI2457953.1 adenine deaminase [candidate division NC10 bacterium]
MDDPKTLLAVALYRAPADLVVRGGILANVYTGELLEGWGVATLGTRIATIGPEVERCIGPATTVIDAGGQIIAPGFIDGHAHLDCIHRLDLYLAAAIPTGLTTLITETSNLSSVGGYPALAAFLGALPQMPVTVLATAPAISYLLSDRGDGEPMISTEEMAQVLEEPGVAGLGEVYWPAILEGRAHLPLLVAKAEALGKRVEGHTAGARGSKLAACVAAGITSCHEPITADEVRERLRLGLTTMVRDGSVRRDLAALDGALKGMLPRRLVLASDTVWAHHLLERGYLDEAARQSVAMGLEPMQALQAITLAPAEHFRIEGLVGGLGPGRQADLVLLPALQEFRPSLVIAHGRVVAKDGRVAVPIPPTTLPAGVFPSPRVARPLRTEDLRIPAPPGRDRVRVRVIHYAGDIVTQAIVREVPVRDGALSADPEADLLTVVVMDRRGQGRIARGFVSGYGLRRGAVAASLSFDTANLILLGASDADMLAAAERMLALGGGLVAAAGGAIVAEVPLPLGGVTSDQPMEVLAGQIARFQRAVADLGCIRENPFLSAQVVTFIAIPALRIRECGLWDVRRNQAVPLIVDEGEE